MYKIEKNYIQIENISKIKKKIRSFSILYQIVKIINYIKFNSQSLQFCSSPRACMTDLGRVPVLLRETSVWSRFGVDGITPGLCSSEGWDRTRCLPPWRGFWCHQPGQVVVARSACPGGQMQSDCGRSFERRVDVAATGLNKLSQALTVPGRGGVQCTSPSSWLNITLVIFMLEHQYYPRTRLELD